MRVKMQRHQIAMVRTVGLFVTGSGAGGALLLWGVVAAELMEPTALYESAAIGLAGLAVVAAAAFGCTLLAQCSADASKAESLSAIGRAVGSTEQAAHQYFARHLKTEVFALGEGVARLATPQTPTDRLGQQYAPVPGCGAEPTR